MKIENIKMDVLTIVRIIGEIRTDNMNQFIDCLEKIQLNSNKYLLDLSNATYINSLGINEIINFSKKNEIKVICKNGNWIKDIFTIVGLDKFIKVYDCVEDACKDFDNKENQ